MSERPRRQASEFEFAYLQLYSRYSPFGGLASPDELAEKLGEFADARLAASLTDTFSLLAAPHWQRLMEEMGLTPLFGAEVGLSWDGSGAGGRTLPASLLLLAENQTGYSNLCRLIGQGLTGAGASMLTAFVEPEDLSRYHQGLIAISPYYGGPITAMLRLKASEAKNRAQSLRDIFGPTNFFLAAPSPAGQPGPNFVEEGQASKMAATSKLNASLVKLARELKLELIATGEARYLAVTEVNNYAALRGRGSRVLAMQYSPARLQQPQDWLYAIRADRPTANLQVYSPQELIAHYNPKDWPGALLNNRAVAARCAGWHFSESEPVPELRRRCEEELERRYPDNLAQARSWLNSELADIEELGLAGPFLAVTQVRLAAQQVRQFVLARQLSGSLVAYLLGVSERPPEIFDGDSFQFNFTEGSRPLRLETGRQGRTRLLAALNAGIIEAAQWKAAPVARPAAEAGGPALLHPRQLVVSINKKPIGDMTLLQPASETSDGISLKMAAQVGPVLPPGLFCLEVAESAGLSRLQMTLNIFNEWRRHSGVAPLEPDELPQPVEGDYEAAGFYERVLVMTRLEWFKQTAPAAHYAAALTLAEPAKRAGWAELVRQTGLKLLPPDLQSSQAYFSLEAEANIRSGLVAVLNWEKAEAVAAARPFASLEEMVQICDLSKAELERLAWSGALDQFGQREALVEMAEALAQAGSEWRNRQSRLQQAETDRNFPQINPSGQLNLFDLVEEIALEEPELKPIELPELERLSHLKRLGHQFETLGFNTTEHPLWAQLPSDKTDSSRSDPLNLGEVLAKAGQSQPLTLAGMIVGLRRLPFTEQGQGQELTIVRLEDWSERLELLIPPGLPNSFELEEGLALTALARWLEPGLNTERPVLVAEALDSYPPTKELTPGEDEAADFAAALVENEDLPAPSEVTPPSDDSWASSLFTEYNAAPTNASVRSEPGPAISSRTGGGGGRPGGGKSVSKPPAPRPPIRHIHIDMYLKGDEVGDDDLMNRLKDLLRQHKGEDVLHIYLRWPDGEVSHLEPQSLTVNYSPEFAGAVAGLLGQPDALRLEERPG